MRKMSDVPPFETGINWDTWINRELKYLVAQARRVRIDRQIEPDPEPVAVATTKKTRDLFGRDAA